MNEQKREALSALIDGELADEAGPRLVDEMLSDDSLKRRWAHYHLIGDVIRKHRIDHGAYALEAEPEPATSIESARRPGRRSVHPVAGLALAASVAAVAVLGINAVTAPGSAPGTAEVKVAQSAPPGGASAGAGEPEAGPQTVVDTVEITPQVVAGASVGIDLTRMTWNDAAPSLTNRLNGYLVTHNEYLPRGMRGMMPYARIVVYDDERN